MTRRNRWEWIGVTILALSLFCATVALYDWSQTSKDPQLQVNAFVARMETGALVKPVLYSEKAKPFGIAAVVGGIVSLGLLGAARRSSKPSIKKPAG